MKNGRWTLGKHVAGVMGVALYLTPTGTGGDDLWKQLAARFIPDGDGFALFSWQIPDDLMGHLDVVLECSGGQTISETFNVAERAV